MSGGTGYVLENLSPGLITDIAKPGKNAASVSFGDTVTLVEKLATIPATWVVTKEDRKIRLPEYILTANHAEIDFLQKAGRIPDRMALVYEEKGDLKTWGVMIGGIGSNHCCPNWRAN
jgi:hypothetical protein